MYKLTVTSTMKAHPESKMVQRCVVYNSKSSFIRYMQADDHSFFVCKDAVVRSNTKDKTLQYRQFSSDSVWKSFQRGMDSYFTEAVADSFLFWKAEVSCKPKADRLLHFDFKHPLNSSIKAMQVDYNLKSQMVEVFEYTVERSMAGDRDRNAVVTQQVHADGYAHAMPQELQQLLKNASDLKPYLEGAYPGYTIQKL